MRQVVKREKKKRRGKQRIRTNRNGDRKGEEQ